MGGEEMILGEAHGSGGNIERILVSIRVRPLNEKEIMRNDVCDWECINNNTMLCKHNFPERSFFPSAYTFDRVFGFDSSTKQVYEEAAKEVAISVLSGINSSIFAYGQTSSGKTHTMNGITKFAMDDIFEYIAKHNKREFYLKFSAMEIYNEAVRDLLSSDNTPLRVLDDPERGTVVEKLTEERLRDRSHLDELLSICETQRSIGETSLNETSSRSHQILRLTIESSAREYLGENSSTLVSSVSFVDLAGSERASQTLSAGTRLKEGCHINRSLLTLGTVIRKLSKGKNGHVPYRDSKLTRILQNSLGGNARTAIICTMSPARSHVEQSRNTLLFASCAKEVTTNAQVNLVVSEKTLVKQLQRELARMESELKSLGSASMSSDFPALLKEKEELIEKMAKQIKDLTWQRDLAQSRVENLLKSAGDDQSSRLDEYSVTSSSDVGIFYHLDADLRRRSNESKDFDESRVIIPSKSCSDLPQNLEDDLLLDTSTPQFSGLDVHKEWEEIARRTYAVSEEAFKEVRCIEMEDSNINDKVKAGKVFDKTLAAEVLSTASKEREEDQKFPGAVIDKKAVAEVLLPASVQKFGPLCAEDNDNESSLEKKDKNVSPCVGYETNEHSPNKGDGELSQSTKDEVYEQHVKDRDGRHNLFVKQEGGRQSPNKEDIEATLTAKQEGDESSEEASDMKLSPGDGQDLNETALKGDKVQTHTDDMDNTNYEVLKEKVKELQKTIKYLMSMQALEVQSSSSEADYLSPRRFKLKRSRSCRESLLNVQSPLWFENTEQKENTSPVVYGKDLFGRHRGPHFRRLSEIKDTAGTSRFSSRTSYESSPSFDAESILSSASIDEHITKDTDAENGGSFHEFIAGLRELASLHNAQNGKQQDTGITHDSDDFVIGKREGKGIQLEDSQNSEKLALESTYAAIHEHAGGNEMAKDPSQGKFGDDPATEAATPTTQVSEEYAKDAGLERAQGPMQLHSNWPSEFERQQRQIIELWAVCNVPLVHRTYFFLLFKGDPSDFVYMEVELRRLSFLKDLLTRDNDVSRRQSVKDLSREKEWLIRQIQRKFSKKGKEELYQKWGIKLNSKQRSLQLVHNLWTDTDNMEHITESAALVAKLVGFVQPSQAPKEMFGLTLSPRAVKRKSFGWRHHSRSLSATSFIG